MAAVLAHQRAASVATTPDAVSRLDASSLDVSRADVSS
jgi:hypothetical protein